MVNRVDIEVTGSNKFDATQASVNKSLRSIEVQAGKTAAAAKKVGTALDEKPKMDGAKEAEKALKKLETTANDAFDKVKSKMNESFDKLGKEHDVKIKAKVEVDKDRFKSSLDGLGGFDIDITKGIGPKIAMAFGKALDLAQAGASGATSFAKGLGDGLKAQNPYVQAIVYTTMAAAVLTVAPFVGAVLAGGIVAGFGAGIAGLGIVAAAQNDKVRSTYSDLWKGIVEDIKGRTTTMEELLLRTAGRAQTIFARVAPEIGNAISAVQPGLEKLLDGLLQSIERFVPALLPMGKAASAVFEDLGSRLPGIIGEMSDEFAKLADVVAKNPEALGDFIAVAGEAVEQVLMLTRGLTVLYTGVKDLGSLLEKGMPWELFGQGEQATAKVGTKMTELSDVTGGANEKVQGIQASFRDLADAEDDAAKRGDVFLDILNRLSGVTPSFDDAMKSTNDTIRGLIDNFTKTGAAADGFGKQLLTSDGHINTMTENGSKLYDAVSKLRENFADMAGATKELEAAGMSHEAAVQKVNDAFATQSQRLIDSASKMGLNQEEMRKLLALYGLTPKQIDTLLHLDDANFRDQVARDLQPGSKRIDIVYNHLNSPLTQGTGRQIGVVDYASGGNLSNAASGGVRSREVRINDGPGGYPGEAVRVPDGSTVWPAGMTRMMMQQASRGATMGGGGGATTIEWIGPPDLIEYIKANVRVRGGDASVFG